jgi:serine/threonine-protein kinase
LPPGPNFAYSTHVEPGRISLREPAPVVPGMVAVRLDLKGRLIEFSTVSPLDAPMPSRAVPTDWDALFQVAQLDRSLLEEVGEPTGVPPTFADERKSWTGVFPDQPDIPIRVEAAALRGKPVYFQIVAPWTRRDDTFVPQASYESSAQTRFLVIHFLALFLAAALLVPGNLRRGRADLRGAARLAGFLFALMMLVWLVETRHVAGMAELQLFLGGISVALYWAGFCWLAYIAVEPSARRFLPETLISWARLLDGRLSDPRVGRDILIGAAGGVILRLMEATIEHLIPVWFGHPGPVPTWDVFVPNTFVSGNWIGNILITAAYCIREGLFWALFGYLVFRLLLGRTWLASLALVAALSAREILGTTPPAVCWPFYPLMFTLGLFILLRGGVVGFIVMRFVDGLLWFPMTMDGSSWFIRDGLLIAGLVVALGGYGFYTAAGLQGFQEVSANVPPGGGGVRDPARPA